MKLKVSVEEAKDVIDEIVTEEFIIKVLSLVNIDPELTEKVVKADLSQKVDKKIDV